MLTKAQKVSAADDLEEIIDSLRDEIKTLQVAIDDLATDLGYEIRNLAQAIRDQKGS